MSFPIGRRIFTKLYRSQLNSLSQQLVRVRLISTDKDAESVKNVSLAPEQEKIHAAVLKEFSNPLVVEHLESPKQVQHNEVLIDVHYCALNASDALLSKNSYTFKPKLPTVLGYEIVGKLIEVGAEAVKKGYRVGDKVVALNKDRYGGLAERCLAEVGDIWKVPSVKSIDAVSTLDSYVTALVALERKVNLDENDMILINVGISGIGLAAVDLATNVFKAKVIGVSSTEPGAELVREKGAFTSLRYKNQKLLKQIEEIAAERNIKIILDDVDKEYFQKVLGCFTDVYKDTTLKELLRDDNFAVVVHHVSREGRVIVAGTATTNTHSEVQNGSFSISGFNLMEYRKKKPDVYRQAGDEVLQFLEEGLITPTCSLIVGLHKINDALQFVSESKSSGKVVIDIRNKEADILKVKK